MINYLASIYRDMKVKEKAQEVIRQLKEQHELIVISSRNKNIPETEQITRDWLEQNGIVYDRLILNTTSNIHFFNKIKVCKDYGVEVMIEDHLELARELSEFIPVILFDYPYNRQLSSDRIIRVKTWDEVLHHIDRLNAKRGD